MDVPDFNLRLARKLRGLGIPVVFYVSPTVWAWRRGRIRQIARDVDRMLCIIPFEEDFYRTHGVRARYVGAGVVSTRARSDGGYTIWANAPVASLEVPGVLAIVRRGPFPAAASALDLDARVHGCVLVVGRFTAADGAPIEGALVFALDHDGKPGPGVAANGATGSGGWFQLRLPRGAPHLYLVREGGHEGRARAAFDGGVVEVRSGR